MSVEFQTKINEPVRINECIEEASIVLVQLLGGTLAPGIEAHGGHNMDVHTIVDRGSQGDLIITTEDDASVDVNIYNFEDPAFQEEAGTWVVAQVGTRVDSSFVLALAFAIAVAIKTHSTVLDDAGYLKLGRHLDPKALMDRLRLPVASASYAKAIMLICQNIGFHFGGEDTVS